MGDRAYFAFVMALIMFSVVVVMFVAFSHFRFYSWLSGTQSTGVFILSIIMELLIIVAYAGARGAVFRRRAINRFHEIRMGVSDK